MSRKGGEEVEKEEQRLRGLEALRQLHSAVGCLGTCTCSILTHF